VFIVANICGNCAKIIISIKLNCNGANKCDLEGIIYQAGHEVIEDLKILAEPQEPLSMIDGTGNIHVNWVIKQISETQSYFDKFGNPRKTEFKIALEKYSDKYESLFSILRGLF
jgi:phage protein U